jgi:hypothetical protein
MTDDLDELAHAVHDLVTATASRQVSRDIAHLAEIEVDSHGLHAVSPPEGYRAPSSGVITTHVVARSRDVPEASAEMRVAVWVAQPGADVPAVLLTRADSDRSLAIAAEAIRPEPTPHLRGRLNDFVALIIAHMVSELNAAMQRSYIRESTADAAEYDGG